MRYRGYFFPPSVTQACHLPHLRKAEYDKPSTASGPPSGGGFIMDKVIVNREKVSITLLSFRACRGIPCLCHLLC